jgi:hypothetical protein
LPSRSTKRGASAAEARRRARGRSAQRKLKAARQLEQLADRCERVAEQIHKRIKGEKITDRLVSLWDPDARPIRKGKLSKPNLCRYRDYAETQLVVAVIVLRACGFPSLGRSRLSG